MAQDTTSHSFPLVLHAPFIHQQLKPETIVVEPTPLIPALPRLVLVTSLAAALHALSRYCPALHTQ
jgi:hypothetical protein